MAASPSLVALIGATVTFGGRPLFAAVDVALAAGDRACLVGRNGSGKSTLMKALAGTVDLDGGLRFVQPGTRIAYLPQGPDLDGFATVERYVAAALPGGDADPDHRVAAALDPLGVAGDRAPETLSGGELRRAALARALVGDPDVLLLDEPTNHLDLPTIEWLEARLAGYRGALLQVSHDRAFLAALSRRTLWLDRGRLRGHGGGFDQFEAWAERVYADEARAADRLDTRIATETRWLREGLTARRKRNQGRLRALQQMRADRRDRQARAGVARLDAAAAGRGGTLVLEARHLTKGFPGPDGERAVVRDFSTRLRRGDRVGVIGPNGAGKTTLVRLLIGALAPDGGSLRLGAGVEPVYFDQGRASLDPEATLRRVLAPGGGDHLPVGGRPRHVAGYLKDFLFDPARLDSPVKSLSGGERNRLLLARLFARPSNLLVLDEPTNDLDIETLDLLQEVLGDYAGTLLLVSHDRDFLDRLVTSVIALEGDGRATEYVGGYADYLRQRPVPAASPARTRARPADPAPARTKPRRKLSYARQRELDRLPGRIDALAGEVAALTRALADPGLYARDPAGYAATSDRLTAAERELAAAEDRWLELAQQAEDLSTA